MKIKALEDTRIKLNPTAEQNIPPTDYFELGKGEELDIIKHENATLDHRKIELTEAVRSNLIWYAEKGSTETIES